MEKFLCKRRTGHLVEKNIPHDEWQKKGDDQVCSFCGSLHPDDVIKKIKEHGFGVIGQTDKDYKIYVGINSRITIPNYQEGGFKYYRHHDTEGFINQWNELIESRFQK